MSEATQITCPQCGTHIPLSEALTGDIRQHLKQEMQKEFSEKEAVLHQKEKDFEENAKKTKEEYEKRLHSEKIQLWEKAQKAAGEKLQTEMEDLRKENHERKKRIEEMQQQELELRAQKRQLEEKERSMALEMERKMDEERKKIREDASRNAEEEMRRKITEKDTQMDQMRKTIEELRRKSEQGSMQIQGDAQEISLKNALGNTFPSDIIEDVPTGIRGGDIVQTVRNSFGQSSGIILWESKNTKAWSAEWIKKLKDDRARVKADVCILVSQVLPEGIESFGMVDGIWVCGFSSALPLVSALRFHLTELTKVQKSLVGKGEKMEYLYQYLSGNEFRSRIENIVSAFSGMRIDLESEKRAMERLWKKREKEIERVVLNTSGMYGDLQGIMGASLATVVALELPGGGEEEEGML